MNDGTVDAATEITTFCSFVAATEAEKARRTALRSTLQAIAQLHIPEATTKIVGSCATGLDIFESGLDLVVETPSSPSVDPGSVLSAALDELGLECHLSTATNVLSVPARSLSRLASGWEGIPFTATVRFRVGLCPERAAASIITSFLKAYPAHRKVVIVVRSVLRQMNLIGDGGGIPSHSLALMAIAFFERIKHLPSFSDIGWVLREFFRFYAAFDYDKQSICMTSTPNGQYVQKIHTEPLSIVDPVIPGMNTASGTTKLIQLKAMFHYITTCIQRFDRVGTKSLLANFVAHNELWIRYEALKTDVKSLPITKDFAMELVNSLSTMLSDPKHASVASRIRQASQVDGVTVLNENLKREILSFAADEGLVAQRIAENPNSKLAPYQSEIQTLADGIMAFKDDVDVNQVIGKFGSELNRNSESNDPPSWMPWGMEQERPECKFRLEDAIEMMSGLADFLLSNPSTNAEIAQLIRLDTTPGKLQCKTSVLSRIVESRIREKPDTKLGMFRGRIHQLEEELWKFIDHPLIQEQLLRVVTLSAIWSKYRYVKLYFSFVQLFRFVR